MNDIWRPDFLHSSPVFQSIKSVAKAFTKYRQWPDLAALTKAFKTHKIPVLPVPQADKPECFEDHYEPRIYLRAELQTRTENWHDFFNAMIWLQFTQTKKVLNQLHYYAALQRPAGTNRSVLENAITLFDECGCVLISDREDLLELVRQHRWHELFYQQRESLESHFTCVVLGHAMHEKALNPYIGMTSHSILMHSSELLTACQQGEYQALDQAVAELWLQNKISSSRDLQAFPLLGLPGWHKENNQEDFYLNRHYFRPKR